MRDYTKAIETIRVNYDESGDYCVGIISIKPFVVSEHPGYDYREEESRLLLEPTHAILVSLVAYDSEDDDSISVCEEWVMIDDSGELHFCVDEWYADPADYETDDEDRVAEIVDKFDGEVIYRR